ncbi:MAG: hypothetical protein IKQ71_05010 [Lachnospiraceae bacterium]|nr:hypothetical protein [Lachnospiraceae bacterium]
MRDIYLIRKNLLITLGIFIGLFLMCVFCIAGGAMLQMLRKMTDSVVAPIIAHAVIDTICNPLAIIFLSEEYVEGKTFQMGCCMVVSSLIIGIPCWVYMIRHERTTGVSQ